MRYYRDLDRDLLIEESPVLGDRFLSLLHTTLLGRAATSADLIAFVVQWTLYAKNSANGYLLGKENNVEIHCE